MNIRKMERASLMIEITKEIEFVAENYCGARIEDEDFDSVVSESYKFIKERFGHITTAEIRIAFRLAASQEIQANIKAYFGKFTIAILGEVLSAYDEYRKPKLIELAKEEKETKMIGYTGEMLDTVQENRLKYLQETIKDLEEKEAINHVSQSDYEYLISKGRIVFKDEKAEKWKLMEDAKPLLLSEINMDLMKANPFQRNTLRALINSVQMHEKNGIEKLAVRAKRLAVVRYLQSLR